jgi:hypothetical protein
MDLLAFRDVGKLIAGEDSLEFRGKKETVLTAKSTRPPSGWVCQGQ